MAKPVVDDVLMALQTDDGRDPVRLSRGSNVRGGPLPRVALDLATTVERIQSVSRVSNGVRLQVLAAPGTARGLMGAPTGSAPRFCRCCTHCTVHLPPRVCRPAWRPPCPAIP